MGVRSIVRVPIRSKFGSQYFKIILLEITAILLLKLIAPLHYVLCCYLCFNPHSFIRLLTPQNESISAVNATLPPLFLFLQPHPTSSVLKPYSINRITQWSLPCLLISKSTLGNENWTQSLWRATVNKTQTPTRSTKSKQKSKQKCIKQKLCLLN